MAEVDHGGGRLDRIERALEFVVERQAHFEERHDREMSEVRQALQQLAVAQAKTAAAQAKTAAAQDRTEAALRRAIRLAVKESRAERRRRHQLGAAMDGKLNVVIEMMDDWNRRQGDRP